MSQKFSSRPNLFHFATSELSQDAFLAWLISWADESFENVDDELNKLAKSFVHKLLGDHKIDKIKSVFVKTQWNKIDVSATINNKYFLLIEDKTGTREHSDQLKRYVESAKAYFEKENISRTIVPVYFKLEEQSDLSGVKQENYRLFGRKEMLQCLTSYFNTAVSAPRNPILEDYYNHIKWLDDEINSYTTRPVEDWGKAEVQVDHTERKEVFVINKYAWQGFFSSIQQALYVDTHPKGFIGWGYVSNAKGGFMGLWWFPFENHRYYIQLEEKELTFRMTAKYDPPSGQFRKACQEELFKHAGKEELEKAGRRAGRTSSLAKLKKGYIAEERIEGKLLLDLEKTIQTIREMKAIIAELQAE